MSRAAGQTNSNPKYRNSSLRYRLIRLDHSSRDTGLVPGTTGIGTASPVMDLDGGTGVSIEVGVLLPFKDDEFEERDVDFGV